MESLTAFGEPWAVVEHTWNGATKIGVANRHRALVVQDYPELRVQFERIVACINFMAGTETAAIEALVAAGWTFEEAHAEAERNKHG